MQGETTLKPVETPWVILVVSKGVSEPSKSERTVEFAGESCRGIRNTMSDPTKFSRFESLEHPK